MTEGRKRLERAVKGALDAKKDKPVLFKGLMGAYVDGVQTVKVGLDREDFVWVRLRGATGEVIQAFNDNVAEVYDLPVLVIRDERFPHIWRIEGRDLGQYGTWGGASYIPPHGRTHSFTATASDAGSDPVWVFKRQFMPFMPRPNASATTSIYLEAEYYFWEGRYHWWPGSGTDDLLQFRPTGGGAGRFVTVFMRGDEGIPDYLVGPEFSLIFPPSDPTTFIPVPDSNIGIPIAAVSLQTGTQSIGWQEIFDLRLVPGELPSTGSNLGIWDEGTALGNVSTMNFVGLNVEAIVSGTFAWISITGTVGGGGGGGGVGIGIYGLDDGVPLGTGTWLDFGDSLVGSISGTVLRIDATHPAFPASQIGIFALDEGILLGTGTWIDFQGEGVTATISGTVITLDIPGGGGGGGGQLGIYGIDDGIPLGTGTWLDFGDDLVGSISGTVLRIDRVIPGTGTLVLYDEQTLLGSVEKLVVEGETAYASQSGVFGFISISGSVGPQGPEGATGSQGPAGPEGATGSAGAAGAEGATGSVGPQGPEGATGSSGQTGPPGADGAEGATGSIGPQGIEGATGSVGPQGPEGATGSAGPQGPEGATGSTGAQGPEGATGSVGPQGAEGATGSQGPQGIEGATGATGPQGDPGGGGGGQLGIFALDSGVPLGTGAWVDFRDNLTATISGTVITVDGAAGGVGATFPHWILDKPKTSSDTPDDNFTSTSLDSKWTVVNGTSGTASLFAGSNLEIYDPLTDPQALLVQVGRAVGWEVLLRQDFTLPDGASIVFALSPALLQDADGGGIANNELQMGMSLNDDDASEDGGDEQILFFDANANGWRIFHGQGASVLGSSVNLEMPGGEIYLRFSRVGLVYYGFYSVDGQNWANVGDYTIGSAHDNLWIWCRCNAAFGAPIPIQIFHWIRQGTNDLYPWDGYVDLPSD